MWEMMLANSYHHTTHLQIDMMRETKRNRNENENKFEAGNYFFWFVYDGNQWTESFAKLMNNSARILKKVCKK
jgi:hypothetical protein